MILRLNPLHFGKVTIALVDRSRFDDADNQRSRAMRNGQTGSVCTMPMQPHRGLRACGSGTLCLIVCSEGISMIGILFLGIITCLLWFAWFLMRKLASHGTRWQLSIASVLVGLILIEAIQHYSGYTLASVWGPFIICSSACVSYILLMFLLWHSNRTASILGLALPTVFVAKDFVGWVVVAAMFLTNMSTEPIKEGRVLPRASYRVVRYPGIWGGATSPYTYEVYKNPRILPFVWKEVAHDNIPCGNGEDIRDLIISADPDGKTVDFSCTRKESGQIPIKIPIL